MVIAPVEVYLHIINKNILGNPWHMLIYKRVLTAKQNFDVSKSQTTWTSITPLFLIFNGQIL